ncbi:MAG TPA: Gfo/Idh/MocA family oxidoreductase [Spirochaetia bacterium]|nr:Gfo/Idh/MocA family oxidoreductase [Spirochaetia bacterium]
MTRWGLLGAGEIARVFANGVRFSASGNVQAVASLTAGRGESLADDFQIPRRYARYEDLLADSEVDAVYVSLIHPLHAQWAIKAAQARKHVLVEKPMGLSAAEAEAMIDAARRGDVFLMEAFMYRCHPQMARLAELIRDGAIGDVLSIRSTFSFSFPFDAGHRLYNRELGGGAILDVGCYPASMSRFIAGAALGAPFADPIRVKANGVIGPSGVDTFSAATVEFPRGIIAQLACGVSCDMPIETIVFGTKGSLSVPNPWLPSSPARTALKPLPRSTRWPAEKILHRTPGRDTPREIVVKADRDLYSYEADMVDAHIAQRQAPAVSWDDSLGNMRLLDAWLGEIRPGK